MARNHAGADGIGMPRGRRDGCYAEHVNEKETNGQRRSIASFVGRDGSIIEMLLRDEPQETVLVRLSEGRMEEARSFQLSGLAVGPYSPENNLLTHGVILFPSEAREWGTDDELLDSVRRFIHRYAYLSEWFEDIASHYVLLSWIYDAFSELPYLRLKGDYGSGKSRCLQTIGSICYKPMFVSGASTVSPIFRIIDAFRGTLVLDESDFRFSDEKAEIVKILNNGMSAGFPVLRSEATPTKEYNPRAFAVFGPKIIATRGEFDDRALESRCITEAMSGLPPQSDIPLSLPKDFHVEALELRNRLLGYRFRNLHRAWSVEGVRNVGLEPRVAQVFGPLFALASDEDARERLLAVARGRTGTLEAERSASIEGQLLGIIFDMRHEACSLGVKDIAERFVLKHGSDYHKPITPRWIGAQLRGRLSLVPRKTHGTFVIPETDPRLAALFKRYGLVDVDASTGMLGTLEADSEAPAALEQQTPVEGRDGPSSDAMSPRPR
jgi:hypothetical protein